MVANQHPSADDHDYDIFKDELAAVISRARIAELEIEGAYDMRPTDSDPPDYSIEIFRIASRPF